MEPRKVAMGCVCLFLSSLILIEAGPVPVGRPLYIAAAASLAIAVWAALAGVRRQDRPA